MRPPIAFPPMAEPFIYHVGPDDTLDVTVDLGNGTRITLPLLAGSVLRIDRAELERLRPRRAVVA